MVYVALFVIFVACIATLIVGVRILQSSRRSVSLGEDRNELLRDQYERLELLREERQVLLKNLEGESSERRQLMEHLEGRTHPKDDLELEQARTESARIAEQSEQERLRLEQQLDRLQKELEREQRTHAETQQRTERLESEHQQLTVDLQNERQERSEVQQRSEQQQRDLALLEQELQHIKEQPNNQRRAPSQNRSQTRGESGSLWRRIFLLGGLALVVLVAWLTSLMVALNILTP